MSSRNQSFETFDPCPDLLSNKASDISDVHNIADSEPKKVFVMSPPPTVSALESSKKILEKVEND